MASPCGVPPCRPEDIVKVRRVDEKIRPPEHDSMLLIEVDHTANIGDRVSRITSEVRVDDVLKHDPRSKLSRENEQPRRDRCCSRDRREHGESRRDSPRLRPKRHQPQLAEVDKRRQRVIIEEDEIGPHAHRGQPHPPTGFAEIRMSQAHRDPEE